MRVPRNACRAPEIGVIVVRVVKKRVVDDSTSEQSLGLKVGEHDYRQCGIDAGYNKQGVVK